MGRKPSKAELEREAAARADLFLAIGEFIFEFSQLEFTLRPCLVRCWRSMTISGSLFLSVCLTSSRIATRATPVASRRCGPGRPHPRPFYRSTSGHQELLFN
jgi:hypothetical protein